VIVAALTGAANGILMAYGSDVVANQRPPPLCRPDPARRKAGNIPDRAAAVPRAYLNLRTARDMGLEIPQSLRLQAQRVFELNALNDYERSPFPA
jgi:hypothetical protein